MPHRSIPGTGLSYELVSFDADGTERTNDPDGQMSARVMKRLNDEAVSDLFIACHGWQGDIPAAIRQCDLWVSAMAGCTADLQRAADRPGFKPLAVGLHWPSQPWGDEEFHPRQLAFSAPGEFDVDELVDRFAGRIAESQNARNALRTIFIAAKRNPNPSTMPVEVADAYQTLNRESGLGSEGLSGGPGADRLDFDPQQQYEQAIVENQGLSFGVGSWKDDLLSPLRGLSFWKMKDRGRVVGESGVNLFLRAVLDSPPNLRVHLMGHSFGCIVVSSAVAGIEGTAPLPRPVQSLGLIQGALSLWSYCDSVPNHQGVTGYFRRLISNHCVAGPIVSTRSIYDTAVGTWYPKAAGVARQYRFAAGTELADLPEYGGVGAFGIQGSGLSVTELPVESAQHDYQLERGRIYNSECSPIIKTGGGFSGAHSDIAHPEIAHLVWSAALD